MTVSRLVTRAVTHAETHPVAVTGPSDSVTVTQIVRGSDTVTQTMRKSLSETVVNDKECPYAQF